MEKEGREGEGGRERKREGGSKKESRKIKEGGGEAKRRDKETVSAGGRSREGGELKIILRMITTPTNLT